MLTTLMFKTDPRHPSFARDAIARQLALIAALAGTPGEEGIELSPDAAMGLADLMRGAADALTRMGEMDEAQRARDAQATMQGADRLRRLGLAPREPMDLHDLVEAFGAYVDSLPETGEAAPGAPRLTEPAPPAARRRAG
jgi:hypothetical protein